MTTFNSIRPSKQILLEEIEETKEQVLKRSDFAEMKDISVEVTELREGLSPKKISSFNWINPEVRVKIEEKECTDVYI